MSTTHDMSEKMKELSDARRVLIEKYLREKRPQAQEKPAQTISRRTTGNVAPLSFGQQQIWLISQMIFDHPVYNEGMIIQLPGALNVAILEQALNEFLLRHEAWRTSFSVIDGQPVQCIHSNLNVTIPVVDLQHLPEEESTQEALRIASEDAQKPFDLTSIPLFRATLFRLQAQKQWLCVTMHHIIFDGVSLYQVFLPELSALYEAFSSGLPSPLAPLPIQYADFAAWQRERLQGDAFTEQMAYWKKQLHDAPALLALPGDHPRPAVQTYVGARRPFALSKDLTAALKALSGRESVTLYITLVAAFQTLLHRYTGQDDLLIGTVTGQRKHAEIQNLMGYFLNTLVLRTDLGGNPSFRELLRRVREVSLDAQTHDVPFEYLVKELQPERNLAQNPLVQVVISLEPQQLSFDSTWRTVWWDFETHTAKVDLAIELDEQPEGLVGWIEYNTGLFDETTIARMAGHWQTLLEDIVAHPEYRLSELALLTDQERQQLLVEWNTTETEYPKDRCIQHLFEEQVERTPEAVAAVFEHRQLTYRELNRRANQVAHHLRTRGVGPEVLVGLCMERSLEMIVGILGILKAGGAYVPLDPTYPSERLAFMMQDSRVRVLLTQQHLLNTLPEHEAHVVCINRDWALIALQSDENPLCEAKAENLAYVIYTSGSTGKPKGVLVEHRGLCNMMCVMKRIFNVDVDSRVLQFASLSFDASVAEIFQALVAGASLHIGTREALLPGPTFIQFMREHAITTATLPPSVLSMMSVEELPDLQTLVVAGESCAADIVDHWSGGRRFLNGYGPTEVTIGATFSDPLKPGQKPVIGQAIANAQVYLLDSHLQPVPVGVPGEIYIGGVGLSRGYLNRPELTAERFIPHPFSDTPHARLYKTGDIARYLSDGNIEFLGRVDHQVKIRGYRVELGEIEAILNEHPAVRQSVVVVREDVPGDKRLVAYCAQDSLYQDSSKLEEGLPPLIAQLRSLLKERLPDYMIPAYYVLLEALPLTPNGKVDRKALPVPEYRRPALAEMESFVAPRTPLEEQVAASWSEVLGIERIGIHDNFFALGGHSLLIIQVVAHLRTSLQVEVPWYSLFEAPTVAELAERIEQLAQLKERTSMHQTSALKRHSREAYRIAATTRAAAEVKASSRNQGVER